MAVDVNSLADIGERSPADVLELLARPFHSEVIQSRRIGGREVAYVPVSGVISRLNKAAGAWNWSIVSISTESMSLTRKGEIADVPVVTVIGALEIPGLGIREGVGTAASEGSEDAGKAAASDALKRASSLFGVPLDGG
jgi:recombination DNA repair RAD52 pathway protein